MIQQQREAGQARVIFKGNGDRLYLFLDSSSDMPELARRVGERLAESPDFYRDAHLWVDWGEREPEPAEWSLLEQTVSAFGIALHRAEPRLVRQSRPKGEMTRMRSADSQPEAEPDRPAGDHTLYVRRTLRSGQRISYDGHVVVLGNVHAGAEVVAGGDIVVFGKLAGVAHAGYPNDRAAVVVAWKLEPMQLRIATVISRAPDESVHPDTPELAQIRDDQIVVGPWGE